MRKSGKALLCAIVFAAVALPGARTAAQGVSTQDIRTAFVEGVALCAIAAVNAIDVDSIDAEAGPVIAPAGQSAREFLRLPPDTPVYDVLRAQGVTLLWTPAENECRVQAYGPRIEPTFDAVATALASGDLAFHETQNLRTPSAILRAFERRREDGAVIQVSLDGGEPGMEGRMFRFPLMFAVTRTTGGE